MFLHPRSVATFQVKVWQPVDEKMYQNYLVEIVCTLNLITFGNCWYFKVRPDVRSSEGATGIVKGTQECLAENLSLTAWNLIPYKVVWSGYVPLLLFCSWSSCVAQNIYDLYKLARAACKPSIRCEVAFSIHMEHRTVHAKCISSGRLDHDAWYAKLCYILHCAR